MKSDRAKSVLAELVTRVVKVRRRLVALALLRSLAEVFAGLGLYVLAFAWLDHRFHFSVGMRCIALLIFTAIAGGLAVIAFRRIRISLGLKHAAGHIESARHYRQQLLAAIEYHQQPVDYPYSQSLAHTMVRQLWAKAKDDDFSATVPSLRLGLFAVVFGVGLALSGWFARDHYAYLSRYLARLGRPTAALAPLPATRLRSLNGDIAIEPNETVTLQAAIEGRLPRAGSLVIQARTDPATEPGAEAGTSAAEPAYDPLKVLTLQPIEAGADEDAMFQGRYRFDREGLYRYRFAAAGEETSWHTIRVCTFPEIDGITAKISFDAGSRRLTVDETVTDFTLSVLAGSQAEITVQANRPLDHASVKHLDDRIESYDVNESDRFTFDTSLERQGRIEFRLHDTEGLWSRELPPLTIRIKEDEAPKFSLRQPEGDGFATNVASVPIEFEIEDDFGIAAATLNLEFGDGRTERIPVTPEDGTHTVKIEHVLELEQYDLDVGDTVLYYASATDVNTGPTARSQPARSDVMFLEIKPYRKRWVQCPDGPGGQGGGSAPPDPALVHDALSEILEYTRAFLKKTWRLANQDALSESDTVKLAAIADDIQYAGENLTLIRDDPRYGFALSHIETINSILNEYESARNELLDNAAQDALAPEIQAYRSLRRLVDDTIQGDLKAGAPGVKEQPDKLELNEVQHLTRLERAQVAWQLNALSQQLDEVVREQEKLDRTFMHFLDSEPTANQHVQVNDEKSWLTDSPPPGPSSQMAPGSANQTQANNRTVEEALRPAASGANRSMAANLTDIMKVLRAHQRRLRTELAALEEQLARMPVGQDAENDTSGPLQARKAARAHLDQAQREMNRFETLLAEQYYDQLDPAELVREAPAMLSAIQSELLKARRALQQEAGSYQEDDTERLSHMALNLEALANAYQKAATPEQRKQLLNELSAVATQFNALSGGPANIPGDTGSQSSGPVIAVKGYGDRDIVEAARFAARQFLSRDIDADRRSSDHVPTPNGGSLEYYDQENDFFESAAKSESER